MRTRQACRARPEGVRVRAEGVRAWGSVQHERGGHTTGSRRARDRGTRGARRVRSCGAATGADLGGGLTVGSRVAWTGRRRGLGWVA